MSNLDLWAAHKARPNASVPTKFERCYMVVALFVLIAAFNYFLDTQAPNHPITVEDALNIKEEGSLTQQAIYLLVYSGGTFLLLNHLLRWTKPRAVLLLGWPLILLLTWSFLTIGWSGLPDVTLRRCIAVLGTVIVGVYGGLRFTPAEMVRLISYVAVPALVGSLALALIDPSHAISYGGQLRGTFIHKNSLGGFAALAILTLIARQMDTEYRNAVARYWDRILCLTSFFVLLFSESATPVPSLVVGLAVFAIAMALRRSNGRLWAWFPAIVAVLLVMGPVLSTEFRSTIVEDLGRSSTLSGRTAIWYFVVEMINKNPWLGYGYGAFWQGISSPGALLWQLTGDYSAVNAHNGYLQLLLDVGIIGALFFLIALFLVFIKLFWLLRYTRESFVPWMTGFMAFFLVNNYTESVLWVGNDATTMLFVYVVLRANLATRHAALIAVATASRSTEDTAERWPH
jgi:O-antigen ligase